MRKLILTALLLSSSGVCIGETTDEMVKRKEAMRERAKQSESADESKKKATRERAQRIKAQAKIPVQAGVIAKKPLKWRDDVPTITGAVQPTTPNLNSDGPALTPFDLQPIIPSISGKSPSTEPPGFTTPAPMPKCALPEMSVVDISAPAGIMD